MGREQEAVENNPTLPSPGPTESLLQHGSSTSFIPEVIQALGASHEYFNREIFDSRLSGVPVITIQTRGQRRSSHAWYWSRKWEDAQGKARPELNVCAEDLRMGPEKTLLALVHEMVHQRADEAGIEETSQEARYHNRRFKELAEEAGLVAPARPDPRIGYGDVQWGPSGSRAWGAFCGLNSRIKKTLAQAGRRLPRAPKPGKSIPFECRCPYTPRQGRADFLAICGRCGHLFLRKGVEVEAQDLRAELSRALRKILHTHKDVVEELEGDVRHAVGEREG